MDLTRGIAQTIKGLCEKRGTSINKMLRSCQINTSLITDLNKGRVPSAEKILKIANFFNVTTDYLLTGNNPNPPNITPEEMELLLKFRTLSPKKRKAIELLMQ